MAREIPPRLGRWIDQHKNIVQPFALSALVDIWFDERGAEPSADNAPSGPILPTLFPGEMLSSMKEEVASLVAAGRAGGSDFQEILSQRAAEVRSLGDWAPLLVPGEMFRPLPLPTPRDLVTELLASGFTQAQIAIEVGTTQATVSRIKRGAIDCVSVLYRALFALHAKTCKRA